MCQIKIIINIPSIFIYKIYNIRNNEIIVKIFTAITQKCINRVFIIKNSYRYIIFSSKSKAIYPINYKVCKFFFYCRKAHYCNIDCTIDSFKCKVFKKLTSNY